MNVAKYSVLLIFSLLVKLRLHIRHFISKMEIIFKKSSGRIKEPKHLKRNIFIIYSPRSVKIEPATSIKIDTELILLLLRNSKEFITSIFRGDKINEFCSEKQRLWIEILNKSFEHTIEIKKHTPLGFVVIEPEHLKFRCETSKNEIDKVKKSLSKTLYKPRTKEATWRFS